MKPPPPPPPPWSAAARTTLSVQVKLNGKLLELAAADGGSVPQLEPQHTHGQEITVAPYTVAWFVFPAAKAEACV